MNSSELFKSQEAEMLLIGIRIDIFIFAEMVIYDFIECGFFGSSSLIGAGRGRSLSSAEVIFDEFDQGTSSASCSALVGGADFQPGKPDGVIFLVPKQNLQEFFLITE
jgi:hypothetical protein